MNAIIIWLSLITVNQHIYSTEIAVNNDINGNKSAFCCIYGYCQCSSFSYALSSIKNNSVIRITSPTVSLDIHVYLHGLRNITISSNDSATVMCSNVGNVVFYACSDVTIEGITWDQCGDINDPGVAIDAASNISIKDCTFKNSKACIAVCINSSGGSVYVANSKFMYNSISNASLCNPFYSTLLIQIFRSSDIVVYNSLFHYNGNSQHGSRSFNGTLEIFLDQSLPNQSILVRSSSFISNGIRSIVVSIATKITLDKINVSDNKFGIYALVSGKLKVTSSQFTYNSNGALYVLLVDNSSVELFNTTFANNNATTTNTIGTALYIHTGNNSTVNLSLCNFHDNNGGNSIVDISTYIQIDLPITFSYVLIDSTNFMNNKIGSALRVAQCFLNFHSTTVFQNNSAKSGAALYVAERSQISMDDGSTIQFINNTALLRGGAMYIDLTNCHDHGIVFMNFTRYDSISFINNSAKLSGNSIYFNIPNSCDVIRDYTNNDSVVYAPYKFSYTQSNKFIGPAITASPYEIKLCSSATRCDCTSSMNNSVYVIKDDVMLGEPVYFNATLCDYFNTIAEATKFQVNCIKCNFKYKLFNNEGIIQNGLSNIIKILSINSTNDLEKNVNITLKITSLFSPVYKQLTATLALTLSPCNNGFMFNKMSQQCECYSKDDRVQCEGDRASIRLGYWFGTISRKKTFSICHTDYCNFFSFRKETRKDFYNLPKEIDDQCNPHRKGVACGQCSEGYTLAYNSPDCISIEKCSRGMTVLVVVLSILYWIAILAMLFVVVSFLNTQQISPGYLYGITFFYSIVDILLVTNLHITDGIFYTVTILSSFAKLNPQLFGKLCFIKDLDAIDQQFIHYCHVVLASIIIIVIYIIAKCNNRVLVYFNRCIVQVTCFILLFSYTSLTSASLLLLRAVKFNDIDGLYTYLSPHLKYFADRHAAYASMAILCILLVTIGLPLLLIMEPLLIKTFNGHLKRNTAKLQITRFMKKQCCFTRIKQLLDQLQDCYKDRYRWFAAYYLICRLVIMLITYFANNDYNYMIYYLQTACVVITMTHIWIQPYKNDLLNKLNTVILLIMLLIVNLNAISFSTSTTTGIIIGLLLAPLFLLSGMKTMELVKHSLSVSIKRLSRYPVRILQQSYQRNIHW